MLLMTRGVSRQRPTPCKDYDQMIELCRQGKREMPRLIHAVPSGATSWFGFANHIRDKLMQMDNKTQLALIEPIPSSEFSQAAKRPFNSAMANDLLQSCLGKTVGKWEDWHDNLYGR